MTTPHENPDLDRYLLFTLGAELYATPLMGVREVVEMQTAKQIPHTVASFLGVINIRGEIVGVVDLRLRLGYPASERRDAAMMVFATPGGALAAVADGMEGVARIPEETIERKPKVDARLPLQYLIGVGRLKERLVTIVDLSQVLEGEEISLIHRATQSKTAS